MFFIHGCLRGCYVAMQIKNTIKSKGKRGQVLNFEGQEGSDLNFELFGIKCDKQFTIQDLTLQLLFNNFR